jgi:tetratricopeptide (TPR) repeat protein
VPHDAVATSTVKSKERVTRRALYLFVGLLATLLLPATAEAQQPRAPGAQAPIVIDSDEKFAALSEGQRLRILIEMIHAGRHDLADRLLHAYPFREKHARNRTLFIEGMILKARGNHAAAIANFRSALADDPDLSLVRMELAHSLYATEQDDGARHHLELLQAAAPTTDTAKQFDRFIDTIDARRPWTLNAYVSLAPSTNFNNGTSERIIFINGLPFAISGNSREKSGIGVRGGANGSYKLRAGKDLDIVASAGLNFTEYDENTFDDLILSQSLSAVKHTANGTVSAGILATERWSGHDEYSFAFGPQITVRQRLAPKLSVLTRLRHTIIDYRHATYRNGHNTSLDNRLSWSFSPGTVGYLLTGAEHSVSRRKFNDYWAASGGLGLYYEAPHGINIYAEAEVRRQWYKAPYPIIFDKRRDTRLELDVSLSKRDFDIFGVTPQLHYSYIKNWSNSPIDEYESHGANLTLTRQF